MMVLNFDQSKTQARQRNQANRVTQTSKEKTFKTTLIKDTLLIDLSSPKLKIPVCITNSLPKDCSKIRIRFKTSQTNQELIMGSTKALISTKRTGISTRKSKVISYTSTSLLHSTSRQMRAKTGTLCPLLRTEISLIMYQLQAGQLELQGTQRRVSFRLLISSLRVWLHHQCLSILVSRSLPVSILTTSQMRFRLFKCQVTSKSSLISLSKF